MGTSSYKEIVLDYLKKNLGKWFSVKDLMSITKTGKTQTWRTLNQENSGLVSKGLVDKKKFKDNIQKYKYIKLKGITQYSVPVSYLFQRGGVTDLPMLADLHLSEEQKRTVTLFNSWFTPYNEMLAHGIKIEGEWEYFRKDLLNNFRRIKLDWNERSIIIQLNKNKIQISISCTDFPLTGIDILVFFNYLLSLDQGGFYEHKLGAFGGKASNFGVISIEVNQDITDIVHNFGFVTIPVIMEEHCKIELSAYQKGPYARRELKKYFTPGMDLNEIVSLGMWRGTELYSNYYRNKHNEEMLNQTKQSVELLQNSNLVVTQIVDQVQDVIEESQEQTSIFGTVSRQLAENTTMQAETSEKQTEILSLLTEKVSAIDGTVQSLPSEDYIEQTITEIIPEKDVTTIRVTPKLTPLEILIMNIFVDPKTIQQVANLQLIKVPMNKDGTPKDAYKYIYNRMGTLIKMGMIIVNTNTRPYKYVANPTRK